MSKKRLIYLLTSLLALATFACGAGQVFADRRVYSTNPGSEEQFYDPTADKILRDDVWVFHSDGTYAAVVDFNGERCTRSGKYEVDENLIYLDINYNDGMFTYREALFMGNGGSYIEWRRSDGTFIYSLAP